MFFFLFVLCLFNLNSIGAPIWAIHSTARDVPPTCEHPDPNHRRTIWNIIWSCLTTIFACTWVSVHPNIPAPNDTWWIITRRRLKIMFYALIAPEVVMVWAIRQWMGARMMRKVMKDKPRKWTKTHGYFLQMGGFTLYKGTGEGQILSFHLLQELLKENKVELPRITEEEINDRSKGDMLAKGLVILQTSWFVAQIIARAAQDLVVTELELITLAFAVLNGMIYFFWWNKPLDVRFSVPVYLKSESEGTAGQSTKEKSRMGESSANTSWLSKTANYVKSSVKTRISKAAAQIQTDLEQKGVIGTIWMIIVYHPLATVLRPLREMAMSEQIEEGAERVPTFYAEDQLQANTRAHDHRGALITSAFIGSVFGAIHCIAWWFQFPSPTERILWRTSSLVVTAVPAVFALTRTVAHVSSFITDLLFSLVFLGIVIYIPARLALLVQALISLRALRPDALQAVRWTSFIPHI